MRTIPDESTGSSIVTIINYSDRIDANNASTITTDRTSPSDNSHINRHSGTFEQHSQKPQQRNDNNTNAIEVSIQKCIRATKSLSLSNDSPAASPIDSDKNYMGSGTKHIKKNKK